MDTSAYKSTPTNKFIPYGRQEINREDIEAVVETLTSAWLTTGPKVDEFEQAVANYAGAPFAVAVSSGTAALHAAMFAIDIQPGDEVILPPLTFAATANAVVYQGGTPVFADVEPETLLLDPAAVENKITTRTKAVIAVDYAGQPCDYESLRKITAKHGLVLIADACHSLGAAYHGEKTGSLADLTIFSFHPVKHITTGEGGMVLTADPTLAGRMQRFRNHGISTDHSQRSLEGTWYYEMTELGYNYRITDFQCALGISQLNRLQDFITKRQGVARRYDSLFCTTPHIHPLTVRKNVCHAYHLYVVKIDFARLTIDRAKLFAGLRAKGIGVNVHYIPVHRHPFYRRTFGTQEGMCPVAEQCYEQILSIPIFPGMTVAHVQTVFEGLTTLITSETPHFSPAPHEKNAENNLHIGANHA